MNNKLLITGGTGFFGKSLISFLKKSTNNYDIYVIARNPEKQYNNPIFNNISFIKSNVIDFDSNDKFDYIIHAATDARVDVPNEIMQSTIVDGTKNMIKFAKKCNCKKMLYISSGAVYGNYNRKIFEDDICNPITVYGKSKYVAEKMCLCSDINITIARCFALSGKYLNKNIHFALGNFIKNAVENQDIIIKSDGTSIRSYLDQDDLAKELIILLMQASDKSIYNIGSDIPISIKQLAYKIKHLINNNVNIKILNNKPDVHNKPMYVPNIDKFNKDFGPINIKSLDDSIIEMSKHNEIFN